jgi:hypothetical protein
LGFFIASLSITACGKKGPPLAPIVHVPAAVDKLAAQRLGNDVYLTLTIPNQNIDASTPADVSRIDIFAVTMMTAPPRPRIFEIATKVASIDVQPAPRPGDETSAAVTTGSSLPAQGTAVTIRESLSSAELVPKELPPAPVRGSTPALASTPPPAAPFPHRYYIAVAVSDRGRNGPPGMLLDVPLSPLPDPPRALPATYTADAISIAWEPSGGVIGFLLENPSPVEPPPVDESPDIAPRALPAAPPISGPVMYNVYRETSSPAADTASRSPWNAAPPVPLNAAPIAGFTYTDAEPFAFGQPRCYVVRAVRGVAPNVMISAPSERTCITPDDTFAPAAPTNLTSVASEGVISLLWEPNGEADLGGYVVLRGRSGDATLQPLTPVPVKDVRYDDHDVMAGVRYVYAVQAVDTHTPRPNVSEESNRVEETAR